MNVFALLAISSLRVVILTSVDGGPATERDVSAKIDQTVMLHAAIEFDFGGKCAWITGASRVEGRCILAGPPISKYSIRVRWSKLEPSEATYDNVPNGHFRLAKITWVESPWEEGPSVRADVKPIVRRGLAMPAGTMRYRVHVEIDSGETAASPNLAESTGGPGKQDDVRKVTIRAGDDYLGVMTELANLPYIFGSTEVGHEAHQAERGIGVDCADLMIYGLRRLGHDLSYRSSRTLGPVSRRIAKSDGRRERGGSYLDLAGHSIPIGMDGIQPGDWIIFEGHVGALFQDRGLSGTLDEQDLMIHIAWKELAIEPLIDSGYGEGAFEVRRADALTSK